MQLNLAAHLLDNFLADRQPQPGSLNRDALCTACAVEGLEQLAYLIGGDATAAIGHRQQQFALLFVLFAPADIDLNAASGSEFNGIIYQVVSHLK